jgi:hypothetical protein
MAGGAGGARPVSGGEVLRALDVKKRAGACFSPPDKCWVKERVTRMERRRR